MAALAKRDCQLKPVAAFDLICVKYILPQKFRRENGIYYSIDTLTRKRQSLETSDAETAQRLVNAHNEACKLPAINLQVAKAYLAAADSGFVKRNWREVMDEFVRTKSGSNRTRSERAVLD